MLFFLSSKGESLVAQEFVNTVFLVFIFYSTNVVLWFGFWPVNNFSLLAGVVGNFVLSSNHLAKLFPITDNTGL